MTTKKTATICSAAVISLALASIGWINHTNSSIENTPTASANVLPAIHKGELAKLQRRIDDTKSPEFHAWREEVKVAQLKKEDVIGFLHSNLSDAQKNVMLDEQLTKMAAAGSLGEIKQWQNQLAQTLLSNEVDDNLGEKLGRILSEASPPEQLAELEDHYRQNQTTLSTGNKLGIIAASKNSDFVGQILDNNDEGFGVREGAVSRLADLGASEKLQQVASETSGMDSSLKLSAMQNLGRTATNTMELDNVIALSKTHNELDSLGRNAASVTQVGVSESNVDGKSTAVFTEWEAAVKAVQNGQPTDEQLVQTLVTGKALAHAIWTESDPATATRIIENRVAPLIAGQLALSPNTEGNNPGLQIMAEFNKDFADECTTRPSAACQSGDDRRNSYREELQAAVQPALQNTELEFYNSQKVAEN